MLDVIYVDRREKLKIFVELKFSLNGIVQSFCNKGGLTEIIKAFELAAIQAPCFHFGLFNFSVQTIARRTPRNVFFT